MNERAEAAGFDTHTSATLLLRLRDLDDREAWSIFVGRYAPIVFSWCRRFHLQESDAADVTQDVLVKLMRHMRAFQYEPGRGKFRGWLKTVTTNTIRDLSRSWEHRLRSSGEESGPSRLEQLQAPDAIDALADELETQHRRDLLAEAAEAIRARVQPHTFRAWEITSVSGRTAAEAATELGISVGDVYVARSRINRMLAEQVRRLERASEGTS